MYTDKMTPYDFDIAVIGAGSGGLIVASGAAGLGAKVALIEGHKMGGDCLNYGCVPSKAFLKAAHLASDMRQCNTFGISPVQIDSNMENVMARVKAIIKEIEPHDSVERYEGLGVTVFQGFGKLKDQHTVSISHAEKTITAKYIVLATGSTAQIPKIPGLDTAPYLTNHTFFDQTSLPEHLIVLGGGPIGLELGQGMAQLGAKVSIIDRNDALFKQEDADVAPLMLDVFKSDGINLYMGNTIKEVQKTNTGVTVTIEKNGTTDTIKGDAILVSLGRKAVTHTLNLDSVGIQTDEKGFIKTNTKLQTTVKNIYACGDVTGPLLFTHMAGYQAGIVLRNTIFKLRAKVDYSAVPWVTYTKPEVAHVGLNAKMATKNNISHSTITIPLAKLDRAKCDNNRQGFLKVVLDKKKRLIGATFVGDKAGEQIAIATLAIAQKLKLSTFMGLIFPYPTESEIYKFAALEQAKKGLKPWMTAIIKRII